MKAKVRQNDILSHSVDDEVVVYDVASKKAHRLNETVSKVWSRLDGERSVADVAVDAGLDESLVTLSICELADAGLLESDATPSISRRSALRRVAGAASVGFLLPAITSIVAPMAAQAASGGETNGDVPNPFDVKPPSNKPPSTKPPTKKAK